MDLAERWTALVEDLTEQPEVSAGKMFGCAGLRTGKKFFAMVWDGHLVVKLPKDRLAVVLTTGGEPFEPMPGRAMGEWVVVGENADWSALAQESQRYVEKLAAG